MIDVGYACCGDWPPSPGCHAPLARLAIDRANTITPAAWIAKLDIAGGPSADLIAGAAVGRTPGLVVWTVVLVGYAVLASIGLCAERTYPMGDETARAVLRQEPD